MDKYFALNSQMSPKFEKSSLLKQFFI